MQKMEKKLGLHALYVLIKAMWSCDRVIINVQIYFNVHTKHFEDTFGNILYLLLNQFKCLN